MTPYSPNLRATTRALLPAFSVFLLLFLWAHAALAAASEWWESDYGSVRLISAADTVGPSGEVPLGLQFSLKPGWKIYWRTPGDAGYPPRLDWQGSKNLSAAAIKWPLPQRFEILGLGTLGYKKEVIFPIDMTTVDAGKPTELNLTVEYLTCSEICVPLQATLHLAMASGTGKPSEFAQLVSRYNALVPTVQENESVPVQGLSVTTVGLTGEGKKPTFWLEAKSKSPLVAPDLYVEGPEDFIFKNPELHLSADKMTVVAKVPVDGQYANGELFGKAVTVTLVDQNRAVERQLPANLLSSPPSFSGFTTESQSQQESSAGVSLWLMLGFALLGGLILNLMPCVLPVLSIKLLGVVKHGGGETGIVRLSFLASAAGIVVSFLIIAAALIGLKSSGIAVGWGIQFQQTWFLISLILMVTLFACNLWGFFEVALPRWIASGSERAGHVQGLSGHFLSGALATLLATPCSAPFLGTAVGFALSRGAFEIAAVFTALGVGLALPYLIVAAAPSLATRLPKPGPWMITLRKVLGFALAATAIWLMSVMMAQSGLQGALVVGGLMAAVCAVLFLAHGGKIFNGKAAWGGVALLAVLAYALPGQFTPAQAVAVNDGVWKNFDQKAIPQLIGDGKLVFVDVTADWCITCQVNKKLVFGDSAVAKRLAAENMIAMKADWTKPSDEISAYLAGYGRYGIPFNIVYGPKAPKGIALPEVMTPDMVIEAMKKAGG